MTTIDEAEVAQRLQVLEDRLEIRELLSEYGWRLDGKEFADCAELWAEDGEFSAPFTLARTRAGVHAFMEGMCGPHLSRDAGVDFHVFGSPSIQVTGDAAVAASQWMYITPQADGRPGLAQFGHYEDTFVREEGSWKFLRRHAVRDVGVSGGGVPAAEHESAINGE